MKWNDKSKKNLIYATQLLLVFILVTWALPGMNKGIDVQDTASYLTKYRYFFHQGVGGNALYYILGEFLGSLIFHIAPYLLALNIANYIIYLILSLVLYVLLKDRIPKIPLLGALIAGNSFGLSWVRCLNWNTFSMLFLSVGLLMLKYGIERGKNKYFLFMGVVLGANAFVRMPNILFLILIIPVFVSGLLTGGERSHRKAKIKTALTRSFVMAAGAVAAGAIGIALSIVVLGKSKFKADLLNIMSSSGNSAAKHNLWDMVYNFLAGIRDGLIIWGKYLLVLIPIGFILIIIGKKDKKGNIYQWVIIMLCILAGLAGIGIGLTREVTYSSCATLLQVQNFIATGGMLAGVLGALIYIRYKDTWFAVLGLSTLLIMMVLTIGTDTGSIYYRVYMALPLAYMAGILCQQGGEFQKDKSQEDHLREDISRRYRFHQAGWIGIAFIICLGSACGLNCGLNYVYHDGDYDSLKYTVEAKEYAGMKTTKERAEYLNRLMELLQPYEQKELLCMGAFNAGYNMTNMKPFYDSAWADLDYLSMEEFNSVLDSKIRQGNYPVIVIASTEINGDYWVPEKVDILKKLSEDSKLYKTLYEDTWYSVYVPIEKQEE